MYKLKLIVTIIAFVFSLKTLGQNQDQPNAPKPLAELPNITPPSPTVAAFMKFEEVPVNNYTGIPDISIPLVSVNTHSKDISINLSLNYHPSSIAVDEEASYVGLGWSLFGGGTISRTVRGLPDEQNDTNSFGIHNSSNPYYEAIEQIGANITNQEVLANYVWDVNEKGRYDSEHDLYQYNFMGHSGRFIITENNIIKKIDQDDATKITYDSVNQTFTLYDDKGYEYLFDVKEISQPASLSLLIDYLGGTKETGAMSQPYVSAFHLSKISDRTGTPLVVFNFSNAISEPTPTTTTTSIKMVGTSFGEEAIQLQWECSLENPTDWLEPAEIITANSPTVSTKKITMIDVKDFARIYLETKNDRQDFAYRNIFNGHRLNKIRVENYKGETIKKIEMSHTYSKIRHSINEPESNLKKRLMLSKVSEITLSDTLSYDLSYVQRRDSLTPVLKDYWGYSTHNPDYEVAYKFRETNPDYCITYALQKIKLPTGGAKIFDWGSNTYSYIGATRLEDFSENPFNWAMETDPIGGANGVSIQPFRFSTHDQKIKINWNYNENYCGNELVKFINGEWVNANIECLNGCVLEANVQYGLRFSCTPGYGSFFTVTYFFRKNPELKYLFGGGIRIDKIGYFEDGTVPEEYYDGLKNDTIIHTRYKPSKEKEYDYRFFNDELRSSGSLVFAKPNFEYTYSKTFQYNCIDEEGEPGPHIWHSYEYTASTDFSTISPLRTKGSDVGYQNVEVSETGNGYSHYVYLSPIDYPEESYLLTYPFVPTSNLDYKRGLLTDESHFNQKGDILTESKSSYIFTPEYEIISGLRISSPINCAYSTKYSNGEGYNTAIQECIDGVSTQPICPSCEKAIEYISYPYIREATGWARPKERITKNYFYNEQILHVVQSKSEFTYNYDNKRIETQKDILDDETFYKVYTYTNLPNNHISDPLSVKSYNNNVLINLEYIDWGISGNFTGQPVKFRKSKTEVSSSEAEIMQEVYAYDAYGNITKMSAGPGMSGYKTIVWGYYDTLPIAIIEGGSTFNDIMNDPNIVSLINIAKGISDSGTGNLFDALNNLRNALPDKMVTTYIHKPLVGITSATDPKGYTTYYEYDDFNRLKTVRDAENNLLSENKYNYKTTN